MYLSTATKYLYCFPPLPVGHQRVSSDEVKAGCHVTSAVFPPSGHTPALACAPNKDVADCLALILSTMKPFPPRDPSSSCSCGPPSVTPSPGLNLLKHCGITASCAPLPSNGLHNGFVKELDGCLSE